MNPAVKTTIVLLLTALSITGCSGSPKAQDDQGNLADSQRSNAKQAQDELSSEISKQK
jgi:hypothetical protein